METNFVITPRQILFILFRWVRANRTYKQNRRKGQSSNFLNDIHILKPQPLTRVLCPLAQMYDRELFTRYMYKIQYLIRILKWCSNLRVEVKIRNPSTIITRLNGFFKIRRLFNCADSMAIHICIFTIFTILYFSYL